jgi:hypothetical protein
MRWFGKPQRKDVWDEPVEPPVGDIEAAERIRVICRSAADSADWIGGCAARPDNTGRSARKRQEAEQARYQRAAKAAMEIAMKVSDELMRDAAVKEIVELCLKAHDVKTARILFRAIQTPFLRDGLLREYPDLVP